MTNRQLALIVAVSRNQCIGKNRQLPWHFSEDFQHFKKTTAGHTIIMGRVTYESIGRPLPKRKNLIVSRNSCYPAEGCVVRSTFKSILETAYLEDEQPFIIGGSTLYDLALPLATTVYLTKVDIEVDGDAFFAPLDKEIWHLDHTRRGETPELTFEVYSRRKFVSI